MSRLQVSACECQLAMDLAITSLGIHEIANRETGEGGLYKQTHTEMYACSLTIMIIHVVHNLFIDVTNWILDFQEHVSTQA